MLCYPKDNPMNYGHGWCHTKVGNLVAKKAYFKKVLFFQGNYYLLDNYDYESKSWGFCSDECFLDESVADTGILRLKENIHVLPEKLCDKYLEYSLEQKPEVKESQEKE